MFVISGREKLLQLFATVVSNPVRQSHFYGTFWYIHVAHFYGSKLKPIGSSRFLCRTASHVTIRLLTGKLSQKEIENEWQRIRWARDK